MSKYSEKQNHLQALLSHIDVDYCEVHLVDNRSLIIQYQGTDLETIQARSIYGGNVRALHKGGWGFASFNDYDELEANILLACEQAKVAGSIVEGTSLLAAVPVVVDDICPKWTLHPEAVSLAEKLRILGHYQHLVLNHEYIPSVFVKYEELCSTEWYANSEGTCIRQEKLDFSACINANGQKNGVSVFEGVRVGSSLGIDCLLNLDQKILDMCELTQKLLDAPQMKAGIYTVVCSPAQAGIFVHEAFGHLSEADTTARNAEFLKAMTIGRRIGRPILNIYDTGSYQTSRGSLVYDDEGVLCRRADLVKDGILVGRLHNRWSAAFLGEEPTGNARAVNFTFPPIVRMRSTCIEAGEHSFEDMIRDIEFGVYVSTSGGGETNGEMFNFSASHAYMIRNGQIAELVRDLKLMGNVFTTMENIDMIGNDSRADDGPGGCGKGPQMPLPVSGTCPHIRIKDMIIGGIE